MTKRTIATMALLAALLTGGIAACGKSNSSDSSQADTSQTMTTAQSDTSQQNGAQSQDRAQRRAAMKKQIEAVLTPDQVKQLESKLQQGEKMRDAMRELNLSEDQKTKIREIYKSARANRQQHSQPQQSETNSQ